MRLPNEVAVMPLPNAVLFPRVLLPLYIFEPRYRKMLADCLRGDRMFAVALMQPAGDGPGASRRPPPYCVAGVGVIRTCVGRSDGTSNLILEGVARVRVCEYLRLRPYRIARIEPLPAGDASLGLERGTLERAVARLAKARARMGAEVPKTILNSLLAVQCPEQFSDLVSYTLLDNDHDKQVMLETLDVSERFHKLVGMLQEQTRQFELWKTLQGKLPNDNVGHN